jgi:hypothetical protein
VRSDVERLRDILEAIQRIQQRIQIERLQEDDLLQLSYPTDKSGGFQLTT